MKIARLSALLVAGLTVCTSLFSADKPLRLAAMAYTFGKHEGFFLEAIEKTAKAGLQYIEISPGQRMSAADPTKMQDLSDAQIEQVLAQAAKAGVKPISIYLDIPNDEAQARARFTLAKKLGVENITTESVESINLIERFAKEFDVTIAIHAHTQKPKDKNYWVWNPDYLYGFLKGRDPRIGVCAESGHWATTGLVSLKVVQLMEGRIKAMHLKERSALGRATPDQIYGTGVNRIGEILAELNRQATGTIVIIEYESNPKDNDTEVASCVKFVRENLPPGAIR